MLSITGLNNLVIYLLVTRVLLSLALLLRQGLATTEDALQVLTRDGSQLVVGLNFGPGVGVESAGALQQRFGAGQVFPTV